MLDQIKDFLSTIPKPVIFAVVLLVILGGFFLWKKFSSKDKETNEVEAGVYASRKYAQGIADNLDKESAPMMSSMTPQYAGEVQTGLQDLESDKKVVAAVAPGEDLDDDDDFDQFDE